MQKIIIFVAIPVIALLLLVYFNTEDKRCPVSAYTINTSPALFADNNPAKYSAAESYLKATESPKWKQTYKFVIISTRSCEDFSGIKWLKEHPEDAVEASDNPYGTNFIIFTNSLPDQKMFLVNNM